MCSQIHTVGRAAGSPKARSAGSTLVGMVDASPSGGRAARDPEHPAPEGAHSGDPEVDDERAEEERWLRELAALAARSDPVPAEVIEAARKTFKTRTPKRQSR